MRLENGGKIRPDDLLPSLISENEKTDADEKKDLAPGEYLVRPLSSKLE